MRAPAPPPERLLIRSVNWLGDAIMTTPALVRLREALPQTHISLLTVEKLADIWAGHPAVDAVIVAGKKDGILSLARQLRAQDFDAALLFPNSFRSALEIWLARIPTRVGYARDARSWLLTHPLGPYPHSPRMRKPSEADIKRLNEQGKVLGHPRADASLTPEAHQIHHYLNLASTLGANPAPTPPAAHVSPEAIQAVRSRWPILALASSPGPVIAIAPGAEYGPAKRWPLEKFLETVQIVTTAKHPCRIILLGGPGDKQACETLARDIQQRLASPRVPATILNLAGTTTLRELAAAIKCCQVVLSNDSGPMHLAAALGVPVVALFGSTSPPLTSPGLPGDKSIRMLVGQTGCAPCFLRQCPIGLPCLNSLSSQQAAKAVLDLL